VKQFSKLYEMPNSSVRNWYIYWSYNLIFYVTINIKLWLFQWSFYTLNPLYVLYTLLHGPKMSLVCFLDYIFKAFFHGSVNCLVAWKSWFQCIYWHSSYRGIIDIPLYFVQKYFFAYDIYHTFVAWRTLHILIHNLYYCFQGIIKTWLNK
jgi:hypothetical protein